MRTRASWWTSVLVAALAAGCSLKTGEVWGPVTDAAGKPIGAARVVVTSADGRLARETKTNASGWYTVPDLPAGRYFVRAEAAGLVGANATVDLARGATYTQGLRLVWATAIPGPPPPPLARLRMPVGDALPGVSEECGLDLGIEGGVAGGVEGGVPGGVVGGVVGGLPLMAPVAVPSARYVGPMNTEAYARIDEDGFLDPRRDPLSTFSVDVDTASYANTRRFLMDGQLPPKDAVRIEEFLNSFAYAYPAPKDGAPFAIHTEIGPCPWSPGHRLVLIGLQGRAIPDGDLPPRNLVFLVDVSGSMQDPRKLPLLKAALRLLVTHLRPVDSVAMVVYAGSSGLALPRTSGDRKTEILGAIERLEAGGTTNGGEGIQLAYRIAEQGLRKGEVNRVVLATDGDFNVGVTDHGALTRLIEEKRTTGVFLSVLGFGDGNLKDSTMESLADRGNGNYSYIDGVQEAHKVLVREAGGTLVTIAKDVKLQVELNPAKVGAYRLLGYENRRLRDEDFKDDRKDAGEIGAGHRVTALYEIAPPGTAAETGDVDPLAYQQASAVAGRSDELMTVKLRYKEPEQDTSRAFDHVVSDEAAAGAGGELGFASAVAEFAMVLRDSAHKGDASYEAVLERARLFRGEDRDGDRAEFLRLVSLAQTLARPLAAARKQVEP